MSKYKILCMCVYMLGYLHFYSLFYLNSNLYCIFYYLNKIFFFNKFIQNIFNFFSQQISNQCSKRQVARRTVKDELEARQIEVQTSASNKLSTGRRTIKDELEARKVASIKNGLSLPQSLPQTVPQPITQSFSQSSNPTNGFVELAVPTVENPTSNKPEQAADVANNNCSMNGITALTLPFNVPMFNGKFNVSN